MTESERRDFRLFCEGCTDRQLENVIAKERGAWPEGWRAICAGIAEAVASARGLIV